MISLSDHTRTIGGCINTPHASQHKLAQNHDGDDDTSPKDSSTTPSTQSYAPPKRPASDALEHQKDGEVVTTPINTTTATIKEENIQALVIYLSMATPLGIDIDMVLPTVSYIQPHSPLRQHVAVGDILINVDGRNVLHLTHIELCSMLSGAPKTKNRTCNEVERQREWTKLVFLPGKYRTKLVKTTTIEQPVKEQQSHHGQQDKIVDDVKNCSLHDEGNVEDRVDRVDGSSMMKEQADKNINGTDENISATSLVEPTQKEDLDSVGKSPSSSLDEVQRQQPQEAEEFGSSDSTTPLTSCTPSSKQVITNDDNNMLTHKPLSVFKHSISDSSPITAATRTSLSIQSITIVPVDEEYQPMVTLDEGHHQQQQQQQQAGILTNESCVMTKATPITSANEEHAKYEHTPNDRNEEEQEGGNVPEAKECKGKDDYVEEQSKSDQVDELDDRDRRRLERMNRAQPHVEFLSISNDPDSEEDVSTLFGGVWNEQLHYAAQRVEDNMLHRMERGAGWHNVVQIGCSQQRLVRGFNSPTYHAAKETKDETSSSFTNSLRQQLVIERALIALCILGVVGLTAFVVVVLR